MQLISLCANNYIKGITHSFVLVNFKHIFSFQSKKQRPIIVQDVHIVSDKPLMIIPSVARYSLLVP